MSKLTRHEESIVWQVWKNSKLYGDSDLMRLCIETELFGDIDKDAAYEFLYNITDDVVDEIETYIRSRKFHRLFTVVNTMFYLYDEGYISSKPTVLPGNDLAKINEVLKCNSIKPYHTAEEFAEDCDLIYKILDTM